MREQHNTGKALYVASFADSHVSPFDKKHFRQTKTKAVGYCLCEVTCCVMYEPFGASTTFMHVILKPLRYARVRFDLTCFTNFPKV